MDFDNYKFDNKKILWCHWDLTRFLSPSNANLDNFVIGMSDYRNLKDTGEQVLVDLRIFLYLENDRYIIRVYTTDDSFDILSYNDAETAFSEFNMLPYNHPEYKERPMKIVKKTNE